MPENHNLETDTLKVNYAYWWATSGPFMGMCGDQYSIALLGIVTDIKPPGKDSTGLYNSQIGIIEINDILTSRELEKTKYVGQKYFRSDCFYETEVKRGDKVIVFCYEYEGFHINPGKKSILKFNEFDDPTVESIKKYIGNDQNPIVIKEDLGLWKEKGLGNELIQIIDCWETLDGEK